MLNPILQKIKNKFNKLYHFENPENNILKISDDKNTFPFAILVYENNRLLLSLTVDYVEPVKIADLIVGLMHVSKIDLSESFYISKNGNMHFGQDAYLYLEMDAQLNLDTLEPLNNFVN